MKREIREELENNQDKLNTSWLKNDKVKTGLIATSVASAVGVLGYYGTKAFQKASKEKSADQTYYDYFVDRPPLKSVKDFLGDKQFQTLKEKITNFSFKKAEQQVG